MFKFNGFTAKANIALNLAIDSAQNMGHTYIGSEHLLIGILREGGGIAASILKEKGITAEQIEKLLEQTVGIGGRTLLTPDRFTPRAKKIIELSITTARQMGNSFVGTEHILVSILSENENYAVKFLTSSGIDTEKLLNDLVKISQSASGGFSPQEKDSAKSKTTLVDQFGTDLTKKAKAGLLDPVFSRDEEIDRLIQILLRRSKNNPCLIGEAGVGKTAVAEGLALKIAENDVPEILKDKRIISIDLTSMVAGTKYRGDFEERIKNTVNEVKKDGNIILFIDEIHTIVGAGSAEGSTDAANMLKPALSRGEIQVIGATTLAEYRKFIEKDAALERRFQPLSINEPSSEATILIIKGLRDKYEAHHKVRIDDEAITAAVELSKRYISDRFLPDKAIDLIDETAARVRLRSITEPVDLKQIEDEIKYICDEKMTAIKSQNFEEAAKLRDKEIEKQNELDALKNTWHENREHSSGAVLQSDIAETVAEWTKIPINRLTEEEGQRLLTLEQELQKRVVGQDKAVSSVARAVRRGRSGISDPKRPIGSFIFLGPTGVGKTELCRVLAEVVFGSESAIIKLDMSEYMEKQSVSKLIGSPPGYVGYDEAGQLTEKIRRKPYSVILFDEIEKAHPDIFNLLLQILDEGVLTDSQGRRVSFKNTIIIMTSNIGARSITEKRAFGFGEQEPSGFIKSAVTDELKRTFSPEFLNRVGDIIIFEMLKNEDMSRIAEKLLLSLKNRLLSIGIDAEFDKSITTYLVKNGFDKAYGARPLGRLLQKSVEDDLSEMILTGEIKNGDKIICRMDNEKLKITKQSV